MEHHEIVIVGAGPAGLTAAKILGEGGKDVLVLENLFHMLSSILQMPMGNAMATHLIRMVMGS